MSEFLPTAENIVREAGRIAVKYFRNSTVLKRKDGGDLVTQADLLIEEFICSALLSEYPHHGYISEETGGKNTRAEYVWILDPIDGSKHFSQGLPLYSISLALKHKKNLVLGIVFNPQTGELFSSAHSTGSSLNGTPIRCSSKARIEESILCVEFASRHFPPEVVRSQMQQVSTLVERAERVRILGVSALGLCYCAVGGFDAYVNLSGSSKEWDLAAGRVILQEAGGKMTRTGTGVIIAGPPALHDELLEIIALSRR